MTPCSGVVDDPAKVLDHRVVVGHSDRVDTVWTGVIGII